MFNEEKKVFSEIIECFSGQFYSKILNICGNCHKTCKSCNGPKESDCISCEKDIIIENGKCIDKACGMDLVKNEKGKCINILECFNYFEINIPKIFFIESDDFIAKLIYDLKNDCSEYKDGIKIKWNEIKNSYLKKDNSKLIIPVKYLKEGVLNFKVEIFFKDIFIKRIFESSVLNISEVKK